MSDKNNNDGENGALANELNEELNDLWNRRDELTEKDWTRFYLCIGKALNVRPRELSALPNEQMQDLIDSFFAVKVFESSSRRQQEVNARFFQKAFRNYLRDVLREQRRWVSLVDSAKQDEPHTLPDESSLLADMGLTSESVATSARDFLKNAEEWVRLYLTRHYCGDKDESEPLYKLARRFHVASYQYRARQLGIIRTRHELGDYPRYKKTLLGQWLISLGIDIAPENSGVILFVFKILCREALLV